MRKTLSSLAAAALVLVAPVFAQAFSDGEVRRVDKEAKKLTIKHGPIPNLDMESMTMVFHVKDPASGQAATRNQWYPSKNPGASPPPVLMLIRSIGALISSSLQGGFCSRGRTKLQPMLTRPASVGPRLAASVSPGPPTVITASRRAQVHGPSTPSR